VQLERIKGTEVNQTRLRWVSWGRCNAPCWSC